VHWAPGIPHALHGRKINANLGRIAPRGREGAFVIGAVIATFHTAWKAGTQYSEAAVMESQSFGVLDTPLSWSMTVCCMRLNETERTTGLNNSRNLHECGNFFTRS
jgi:hypothetical protein